MNYKYEIFFTLWTLIAFGDAFELGTKRSFSLTNDVDMYDLKLPDQPIGYRISSTLMVAAIWGNDDQRLLRFQVESPQLHQLKFRTVPIDYEDRKSILDLHDKMAFYADWNNGMIGDVYLPTTKDISLDNFMRSIVSMFQYQLLDKEQEEIDISGSCQVRYVSKSSTKYLKYKNACTTDMEYWERQDRPLGVSSRASRVNVITVTPDGKLESVHSSDRHKYTVNEYPDVGLTIGSLFFIKADGRDTECKVIVAKNLTEAIKSLDVELTKANLFPMRHEVAAKSSLVKLVKDNKENLKNENVGKNISALTLLRMLPTGRKSTAEEFTRILKANSMKEFRTQLMDFLGAVQTLDSHEALRTNLNFTSDDDFDDIERYLQALAVGIHPHALIVRDLLEIAKSGLVNQKLLDTLVQTIAAMAHRFAIQNGRDFSGHLVREVVNFLLKSVNSCTTGDCKVIFIRGLQNLQSPETIDKLLGLALNHPYKISVAAIKALRTFPSHYWTSDAKLQFEDIFYQKSKKFDTSARTIALDILLTMKLEADDVVKFLNFLRSSDRTYEVKQYLIQRLKMHAEECKRFNEILKKSLAADPQVNNWNIYGGLKGLSSALKRRFSKSPSYNGSLLSVQEINGGVLKRGSVDLLIESGDEEFSLFSLGLFAGGLSSFISSSDEQEFDPDEDTTATAGMELAIQGVQMRPLTFFSGQGELMGHVWSGTASEATPAYQGVTLTQDHKQMLSLNNGALLDFSALGAFSVDLNGKIEISLWYKNANSEIVQNSGTALQTVLMVDSSIIQMVLALTLTEEPQIHLASKVDFSSKTAICMQLSQPNTQLIQEISRKIQVPGDARYVFSRNTKLRYNLPGCTHVLNRKNSEICNQILK